MYEIILEDADERITRYVTVFTEITLQLTEITNGDSYRMFRRG